MMAMTTSNSIKVNPRPMPERRQVAGFAGSEIRLGDAVSTVCFIFMSGALNLKTPAVPDSKPHCPATTGANPIPSKPAYGVYSIRKKTLLCAGSMVRMT